MPTPTRRVESVMFERVRRRGRSRRTWDQQIRMDTMVLIIFEDMTFGRSTWRNRTRVVEQVQEIATSVDGKKGILRQRVGQGKGQGANRQVFIVQTKVGRICAFSCILCFNVPYIVYVSWCSFLLSFLFVAYFDQFQFIFSICLLFAQAKDNFLDIFTLHLIQISIMALHRIFDSR